MDEITVEQVMAAIIAAGIASNADLPAETVSNRAMDIVTKINREWN